MYEHITYLPQGYEKTEKNYPLLIFLHDKEQAGYEFDKIRSVALPKLLEDKYLSLDMIIVAPQTPPQESWKATKLMQLLIKLDLEYRIDTNRIYFTGIGYGGHGALKFATVYKNIPAAIISVAGGGNENMAFYLQNIPLWLFHGTEDQKIPFYKAEALAKKLESLNPNFNFTAIENAGYEICEEIYKNTEIYEWLLKFSL
jgi:predicted peptidase